MLNKIKPIAAIVGAGRTKFGEHWSYDPEQLMTEAGLKTFESVDKGLGREDINACYFSSFLYHRTNNLGLIPGYMSRELGLNIPMTGIEAACASGGVALYEACLAIQSGKYKVVLVGGFEKMTDSGKIIDDLMLAAHPKEFDTGHTFVGLYAMMASRYIYDYAREHKDKAKEALALVACKNHKHAIHNEYAQFRKECTIEDVFNSPLIADPLRMLHCSPISDGAAALILVAPEVAKKYTDTPIYIVGSEQATSDISLYGRESLTSIPATRLAVEKVFKATGLTQKDIELVEVHDCFTIEEIIFLEDFGFCERGMGWKVVCDSYNSGSKHIPWTNNGKEIIFNPGGGLKADGHPVGVTGIRQVYECFKQLRQEASANQVEFQPQVALCHNIGGTGGICTVHLLTRGLG